MAKGKGKGRRTPHRSATRGRAAVRRHPAAPAPEDLELARGLREAMRGAPLSTATLVSQMIEYTEAGDDEGAPPLAAAPTLANLVESLIGIPIAETTAALHVMATLLTDEVMATRIRRELAGRKHPMPIDVAELASLRITRAVTMTIPGDVGEDVMLELTGPGVRDVTLMTYVDFRGGPFLKDAFLMPSSLEQAKAQMREIAERDGFAPDYPEVSLADARARLEAAMATYGSREHMLEPQEMWPGLRPLLRFLLAHLPTGGSGYPGDAGIPMALDDFGLDALDEDFEEEAHDLAHAFLAAYLGSEEAEAIGDDDLIHDVAHEFAAIIVGEDEQYSWETIDIERVMTRVLPPLMPAELKEYCRAPEVLQAFVRHCHAVAGVEEAVDFRVGMEIARWVPDYLRMREDPGVVAIRNALETAALAAESIGLSYGDPAVEILGSVEALATLDDEPLPDEPLDVSGVPADIVERVRRMSALADGAIARLYDDVELRTAARRLIAKVAAGDPAIFRRKSGDEMGAAALVWLVAKANDQIGESWTLTVGELMDHFGLKGSPSQRAQPMLGAIGGSTDYDGRIRLADPLLLTSETRAELLDWFGDPH